MRGYQYAELFIVWFCFMMIVDEVLWMDDKWLIVFVSSGIGALLTVLTSRILFFTSKKHELRERIFNSLRDSIQQAESTTLEITLLLSELMSNLDEAIKNKQSNYRILERNEYFQLINRYHVNLNELVIWFNLYNERKSWLSIISSFNRRLKIVLNDLINDMKHDYEYFCAHLDKIDSVSRLSREDSSVDVANEIIEIIKSFKVSELHTQYSQSLKNLMSIMYKGMRI